MRIPLMYDKLAPLKITVSANGIEEELYTIIDTGYTAEGNHGLTLPPEFLKKFKPTETISINTAGEEGRECPFIPDLRITKIRDYQLCKEVTIPAIITGKISLLGVMFLQNCILHLDGEQKNGYLELDPSW